MNRLARWMMRLYPARWRRRYGDEVGALVEDTGADMRVVADLLKGAVRMQFSTWSFPRLAMVLGIVGMVLGLAFSLLSPSTYVGRAELALTGADSPVETMEMLQMRVTGRGPLSSIINEPTLNLYREELTKLPLEDVIGQMRGDISFSLESGNRIAIQFSYPDKKKAERTARALAESCVTMLRTEDQARQARKPGVDIIDTPSLPHRPLRPNPLLTGLAGLMAGLVAAGLWRLVLRVFHRAVRPRRFRRTACWLALAGTLAGVAAAWIIASVPGLAPDGGPFLRYQSRATLYAEDTPGASVADLVARLTSRSSMTTLIVEPRLRLYANQVAKRPLEDVAEAMRRDFVVTTRDAAAGARWIDVSFVYPDPKVCQQVVQVFTNHVEEEEYRGASRAAARLAKWGAINAVNSVTVAAAPVNRAAPVVWGLGGGLFLAVLIALVRRRWIPEDEEEFAETAPVRAARFDRRRFAKLAVWLTGTGVAAGAAMSLLSPARYVSEAEVAFDNAQEVEAAGLISQWIDRGWSRVVLDHGLYGGKDESISTPAFSARLRRARKDLSWEHVDSGGAKTDTFRFQFVADDPEQAHAVLDDVLGDIDHGLTEFHGGDDTHFDAVRGVDGKLLPVTDPVPGPPSAPQAAAAPVTPSAYFSVVAALGTGVGVTHPVVAPSVHANDPSGLIPAAGAARGQSDAIPFDDERARPVPLPAYRAVRMEVIDPPSLPSLAEGIGWWMAGVGGVCGVALTVLLSFLSGFGGFAAKSGNVVVDASTL